MKRRFPVVASAVAVASMLFVASSFAHARSHPGDVTLDGFDMSMSNPAEAFAVGHVVSPIAKCIPGRTVKILYSYGLAGHFKLVDVAKSGQSGAFAGEGPGFDGDLVEKIRFVLVKKSVGPRHHRQTCKGKTRTFA